MNPSGFTLTRFLSGAYKTLTIANQVIPIYKQVSPMIKNARSAFSVLSEINKSSKSAKRFNVKKSRPNYEEQKKELSLNNPVFFV